MTEHEEVALQIAMADSDHPEAIRAGWLAARAYVAPQIEPRMMQPNPNWDGFRGPHSAVHTEHADCKVGVPCKPFSCEITFASNTQNSEAPAPIPEAFDVASLHEGDLVSIYGRPPRAMYAHDVEYPLAWQSVLITDVWRLSDAGDYVRVWPPRVAESTADAVSRESGR